MKGKIRGKKRMRRIGALVVLGIFAALMLAQPAVAADITMGDDEWIGLGAAAGRIVFDSTPTPDQIEMMDADVGINDADPDFRLEIAGSSGSGYFGVSSTVTGDGDIFVIDSYNNVGVGIATPSAKVHIIHYGAYDPFRVDDADSDFTPFVIDQYGNVGIGTPTPGAKLDVDLIETEGGAATIGAPSNSAAGDFAIALGSFTTASGMASLATGVATTASGSTSTAMGSYTTASASYSTAMGYGTVAGGGWSTAMGTFITVSSTGTCSFGIGLDFAYPNWQITQANTMAIMGGKVGIGIVSPGARLHSLATTEQLRLGYDASNYASFTVASDGALTIQTAGTDEDIEIRTGSFDNAIFIDDSASNVGIGTANPGEKFEVYWESGVDAQIGRGNTDDEITYIRLRSPNGSDWYLYPDDSGNLQIDATEP
jgi:hypothetical protein